MSYPVRFFLLLTRPSANVVTDSKCYWSRVTRNHANLPSQEGDNSLRNEPSAERTPPSEPISNRNSKLLEFELSRSKQSTSHFLIDNFQRLHREVVDPERSRRSEAQALSVPKGRVLDNSVRVGVVRARFLALSLSKGAKPRREGRSSV